MYKTMGKLFGGGRLLSGDHHEVQYKPDLEFRQEVEIRPEEYFAYRVLLPRFDAVAIHIEVLEGNDIDCLVMNEYNFEQYTKGDEFVYLLTGSILDVKMINYLFVAPEVGMYYFVLDNTSFPEHGARPKMDIERGHTKVLFDMKAHMPVQMVTPLPQRMIGT